MPSLEAVCGRLFGRPGWIPKALWGGLLSFVPILNLLALGYLIEYTQRLRRLGEWELPDWRDQNFPVLFGEGIRAFLVFIAYAGVPLLAGWLLSEMVDLLTFGLLGIVSHFPLAAAGFIVPFLFYQPFMPISPTVFFRCLAIPYRVQSCPLVLAPSRSPCDCLLGNFSARYSALWALPLSWTLGTSCLFDSLAICRLIDYFERLRN